MQSDKRMPLKYDLLREQKEFRNFKGWLRAIGFWNGRVYRRLKAAGGLIPDDVAEKLCGFLKERIDEDCILLLRKLHADPNGLPIRMFGFTKSEIDEVLRDGDCACALLRRLRLIIVENGEVFRPRPISFDWRVLNLLYTALAGG